MTSYSRKLKIKDCFINHDLDECQAQNNMNSKKHQNKLYYEKRIIKGKLSKLIMITNKDYKK